MPPSSRPRLAVAASIASILLVASACSSSDNKKDVAQASNDEIKSQAADLVSEFTKPPTSIGITEPVQGPIPTGKKVAYMNCSLPSCSEIMGIAKEAAAALGWEVVPINIGATPETVKAGYERAVQMKPDAVVGTGYGPDLFSPELDQLKELGIPVMLASVAEKDPRLTALFQQGSTTIVKAGNLQADWVLSQHGSDANTLAIDVPDLTSIHSWYTGFEDEYQRLCPNCELGKVQLASTDLGTPKVASQIAAYVQAHPDVKAIQMSVGSIAYGLPEALEALGYDGTVGVLNADDTIRDYMRNGQITMSNSTDWPTTVWKWFDTAARLFTDQPITPDEQAPENYYLYTADDIPEGSGYSTPIVLDYEDQFKKLWGLE